MEHISYSTPPASSNCQAIMWGSLITSMSSSSLSLSSNRWNMHQRHQFIFTRVVIVFKFTTIYPFTILNHATLAVESFFCCANFSDRAQTNADVILMRILYILFSIHLVLVKQSKTGAVSQTWWSNYESGNRRCHFHHHYHHYHRIHYHHFIITIWLDNNHLFK